MNITVSAYNRPQYLERTLAALSMCDGIDRCTVMVMLDPCHESDRQLELAEHYGFQAGKYTARMGCNAAIGAAMSYGFLKMGGDFHVHLEDDTVPTRDALLWFAWARDEYRDDPAVMNVSGYQRLSNGQLGEAGLRRWFTPWGWGTWRDRWIGMAAGWAKDDEVSWDVIVNLVLRAGRYEVFPTVSRIQNIGGEKGTHVPNPEWHAENHHVPQTADDLGGDTPGGWVTTRIDDHADHA